MAGYLTKVIIAVFATSVMLLAGACTKTCSSGVILSASEECPPSYDQTASWNERNRGIAGPVAGSQEDLEQTAGNRIFFGYDEYALTQEAQEALQRQAAWLRDYPAARIQVAGNCDERGTREYNLALGARRAEAARAYLVSLGVDPARITTVSYGKERPIDMRSSEEAWAINRNVTTTILSVES